MALRVTIAGMGLRGCQWARQIQASPAWELTACADVDPDALDGAASSIGLPRRRCFSNVADALDAHPPDVVVVATTSSDHEKTCEQTLARGLATLVEKPFTHNLAAARALVDLAEQQGAPLVVGQNLRYTRAHRTVRRLVEDGALGRVRMVVCQTYRPPEHRTRLSSEPRHALWDIAVHQLDTLRHTVGEITGVMVETFNDAASGSLPAASFHAMLTFGGGARGLCSGTYESSGHEFFEGGQESYERIVGERATLHVLHRWLVLCPRGKLPRLVRRGPRPMTEEAILLGQVERALRHGEEPEASGRDNLATVAALEACTRSAQERSWVNPMELLAGA